jgi:hypothetical protein
LLHGLGVIGLALLVGLALHGKLVPKALVLLNLLVPLLLRVPASARKNDGAKN